MRKTHKPLPSQQDKARIFLHLDGFNHESPHPQPESAELL